MANAREKVSRRRATPAQPTRVASTSVVQTTLLLATIHSPDTNPVSLLSVSTLIACTALTVLLSLTTIRHSVHRQRMAVSAAGVAAGVAVFFAFALTGVRRVDADLMLTATLLLAFAFGYAMSGLRGPSLLAGGLAALISAFCAYSVGFAVIAVLNELVSEGRDSYLLTDLQVAVLPVVIVLLWGALAVKLLPRFRDRSVSVNRSRVGHCTHCDYDLRGSADRQACPECGKAIDWEYMRSPA